MAGLPAISEIAPPDSGWPRGGSTKDKMALISGDPL